MLKHLLTNAGIMWFLLNHGGGMLTRGDPFYCQTSYPNPIISSEAIIAIVFFLASTG